MAGGILRNEVGAVDKAGQTVGEGLHGTDHVETQEGQMGEIVVGDPFPVEVGVDQAQSLDSRDT